MPTESQSQMLQFLSDFAQRLPEERILLLREAAAQMHAVTSDNPTLGLLFVCTHNSRRSQFGQFWAAYMLQALNLSNLASFSCGTETTECNPRTVASLERTGAQIKSDLAESNPQYAARLHDVEVALFSKAFGDPSLPTSSLFAMMCCDDADHKCPTVPGAIGRVALHYQDPKISDGTDLEAATYDERNHQIASEMYYLLSTYQQMCKDA